MTKPKILISACLLGERCRYDGRSKPCAEAASLAEQAELIPICPERDGGLSTPREPSEIRGNRVISVSGRDVTAEYTKGAQIALKKAIKSGAVAACLKARSPSCGAKDIYDGTFSGRLIPGKGVSAELLIKNGICVFDETELDLLKNKLKEND